MATAKSYDPGTEQPVRRIAPDTFAIDSFRGEAKSYEIHLGARPSCTCPHFVNRLAELPGGECKHIQAARRQAEFLAAVEKARTVPDAQLDALIGKYGADAVISGALRVERERRRQAGRPGDELRAIFA